MKRSSLFRGGAVLAAAALAACEAPTTAPAGVSEDLVEAVEALGFRGDMVQDFGDHVVVEGDVVLTYEQLRAGVPAAGPGSPRFQYRTTALVGSPKVHQVVVDLSGLNAQTAWQSAARDAITHWNGISGSYVKLVEGSPADVSVGTDCGLGSNVAAQASWPSGGNPGPTIHVNPCFGYSIGHAQRVHNMVHEFGHTLGFRHTNWQSRNEPAGTIGAVHVPGTPTGSDAGSVMNGGTALSSWAGFSTADRTAVRYLYPLPLPSVSVSYPAGTPTVTWGSLAGASAYRLFLVTERYYVGIGELEIVEQQLAYTSGTSATDPSHGYTGNEMCEFRGTYQGGVEEQYFYRVEAQFANGTSSRRVTAAVGDC